MLVAAISGCGVSSPLTATSVRACTLVSVSDIETAYGGTVSPGTNNRALGVTDSTSCTYAVKGGNVGIDGDVEINVYPPQSPASFQAWANDPTSGNTRLSGLGDAAFYNSGGGGAVFLKGRQAYGCGFGLLASSTSAEEARAHTDDLALATVLAGKV